MKRREEFSADLQRTLRWFQPPATVPIPSAISPRVRASFGNLPLVLVSAMGASYLTTFVRERFYYQHALGTHVLDHLEVLVSATTLVSNAVGLVILLWWSAGRLNYRAASVILAAAVFVAFPFIWIFRPEALLVEYALGSSAFIFWSQRAASQGRQIYAIAAAITAPISTLVVWSFIGTSTLSDALAGYVAGIAWQATGSILAGRGAKSIRPTSLDPSMMWPILYVLGIQIDAVIDQIVLLVPGAGWAGSGALAFSFFAAATVIVVGPIAAQALAGRLRLERSLLVPGLAVVVPVLFLISSYFLLPLLIRGGLVRGTELHRILYLTILYGCALPFAIYWQVMTRAGQRDAERWRPSAVQAAYLVTIHALVLAVIALSQAWILIPLATVAGYGAVSVIYARGSRASLSRH